MRAEWEAAAGELFPLLDPAIIDRLVGKFGGSLTELRAEAVTKAMGVVAALAKTGEPVAPHEYQLVVVSTLSVRDNSNGVLRRVSYAVEAFRWNRRYPNLDPSLRLRIMAYHHKERDELAPLLERCQRVGPVKDRSGSAVPRFLLDIVVPAVMAVRVLAPSQSHDDVTAAQQVLDRGAELAVAYRASGRPVPVMDLQTNDDFLQRMAAYRTALDELRAGAAPGPVDLDVLAATVDDLVGRLRRAVRGPVGLIRRNPRAEPDLMAALDQFAEHLGGAAGERSARLARIAYTLLTRDIRLPTPPDDRRDDDRYRSSGDPRVDNVADVDHIVGWLVFELYAGADAHVPPLLTAWLTEGSTVPPPSDLMDLVRRLRVASFRLNTIPDRAPPRPHALPAETYEIVVDRLLRRVGPEVLEGNPRAAARQLTHLVLPRLWTRRRTALGVLAAELRAQGVRPGTADVVAGAGARAPVQFVARKSDIVPAPCCAQADGRTTRSPVDFREICPHRPWSEIGWVENYRTIGERAGISAEAARRQLERYSGPYLELLLEVRDGLTPDDC